MNLLFASPTYGAVWPMVVVGQRLAIMHAAQHGVTWVGDVSPHDVKISTIDYARNRIIEEALRHPTAEGILWADSDIEWPVEGITRLATAGHDFVTGIYCQRQPPYAPVIARFNPDGGGRKQGAMQWCVTWPTNVIAPIDACGFGCVFTSLTMLRALTKPWFAFGDFSEDFTFCLKARAAGFQLYVDTGVECGHVRDSPHTVRVEDFHQAWQGGTLAGPPASAA